MVPSFYQPQELLAGSRCITCNNRSLNPHTNPQSRHFRLGGTGHCSLKAQGKAWHQAGGHGLLDLGIGTFSGYGKGWREGGACKERKCSSPEETCCLSSGHGNQGIHSNTFMWFLGGCLHQSRDHPDTTVLGMRQ